MEVTKIVPAPVERVWAVFADLAGRPAWLSEVDSIEVLTPGPLRTSTTWRETRLGADGGLVTERLVASAVEPGRACTIELADTSAGGGRLTYLFAPVDVGPDRGATAVTATAHGRPHGLAGRMLAFVVGTLAARTAEGALRDELDALAAACATAPANGPGGDRSAAA